MPSVPKSQVHKNNRQKNNSVFFLSHQFCDAKLAFWNPHSSLQMMCEIKYSYLHWTKKKIFPNSALTCYFSDAWYPVRHCQKNQTSSRHWEKCQLQKSSVHFSFLIFLFILSSLLTSTVLSFGNILACTSLPQLLSETLGWFFFCFSS